MASKKQSQFTELSDVTDAYLSGHKAGQNYKIPAGAFAQSTHVHNAVEILNDSGVSGTTVRDALDTLKTGLDNASAGSLPVSGISNVPASALVGNPTGTQASASAVTLDSSLTFSGTTLAVSSTTTPAAGAIPEGGAGGSLAAWIPDATNATKGLVQFGGDLDANSTVTAQVVSKATFDGTQYTLGALTNGQTLVVSGTTITSSAPTAGATIATQGEAETGTDNTKVMSPLRTKDAVIYYGVLKDFSGYTTKGTPVAADTVLLNDSAESGAIKKATVSSLVSGASGLAAASQSDALAITSNAVGITPLRIADLNAEYRMFSEKAGAVSSADVTIDRSITVCDTGVARVFLPPSDGKIPTTVIYNDTPSAISIYPNEGRLASGAYFNSNVAINFPRTSALGGFEGATMTALTGIIEFTVDAWPVAGTGATLSRILVSCRGSVANDWRGFQISNIASGGSGYIHFSGYEGGNQLEGFSIRSSALALTTNTLVELVFSFDLNAGVFKGYVNGASNAWDGITQVWPASKKISMPAASMPLRVGHRSIDSSISTAAPWSHLGNMYRVVLWHDWYVDLDDVNNMSLLREAGKPKNLGKTGWRPRGNFSTPASIYLNGGGDNFRINQAPSFDNASNVTGTLVGSSTTPAPANNATLLPVTVTRPGLLAAHNIKGRTAPFSLPAGSRASFTLIEGQNTYVLSGGA